MEPEHNETPFDWIRGGRDQLAKSRTPEWAGNFVSHLMPAIFESYAKVLHRIDVCYENIDNPLSPAEISVLRIPFCKRLRDFIEKRRSDSQGTRVRWKELADLLDVPFVPEICHEWYRKRLEACWPRFLRGPSEGTLAEDECTEMAFILKPFTSTSRSFFRLAEIPFIATDRPLLLKGELGDVPGFLKSGAYQFSFEYWWPSDQTWCVSSDYDLHFTFVGGSRKLISALLASEILECLEVTSQTRIDSFAPMP